MHNKIINSFFDGQCIHAHKVFGVHAYKKGYTFTVWAPNAKGIQVSCNDTLYAMEKIDNRGIWNIYLENIKANDTYTYWIEQMDGNVVEKIDPFAFYCEKRPSFKSIISDLFFAWEDEKWMLKRSKNFDRPVSIYEVYPNSFMCNTYKDMAKALIAHVKKFHYTHVEFMPLHEHPYDGSWGYQISGMYALTSRYGSIEDFKYLVNALHKENIGVILDFVPIHFASDAFGLHRYDGSALFEYEESYNAYSEWGSANFNLCKKEVQSFLMSAAMYWLEEYHIDGLRMDAISHAIYWQGDARRGENLNALNFLRQMNQKINENYPQVMIMAEDSTAYPKVSHPIAEGGLGFDYKWNLGWMNDTLRYLSMDPIYRKWHHNDITFSMAYFYGEKYVLPLSHDEVVHEKKTIVHKMWGNFEDQLKQARMLYTYMYTHPGKKLNFMGNEFAMRKEFNENKKIEWELLNDTKHEKFALFMQTLLELYANHKVLYEEDYEFTSFEWIDADNSDENLFSFMRKGKEETIVVILNMSPVTRIKHRFGVNEHGFYKEVLNSEHSMYGGSGIVNAKVLCAKKGECNYKPYYLEVDVAGYAGILLVHKNGGKK